MSAFVTHSDSLSHLAPKSVFLVKHQHLYTLDFGNMKIIKLESLGIAKGVNATRKMCGWHSCFVFCQKNVSVASLARPLTPADCHSQKQTRVKCEIYFPETIFCDFVVECLCCRINSIFSVKLILLAKPKAILQLWSSVFNYLVRVSKRFAASITSNPHKSAPCRGTALD